MGYTTNFSGYINIEPPCMLELRSKINKFCRERHGGSVNADPSCPGFWCDWQVSEGGATISWNGSEKSYDMERWLPILIEKFFVPADRKLNGTILAQGEGFGDVWRIEVNDNVVERNDGHGEAKPGRPIPATAYDIEKFLDEKCDYLSLDDEDDRKELTKNLLRQFNITMLEK